MPPTTPSHYAISHRRRFMVRRLPVASFHLLTDTIAMVLRWRCHAHAMVAIQRLLQSAALRICYTIADAYFRRRLPPARRRCFFIFLCRDAAEPIDASPP